MTLDEMIAEIVGEIQDGDTDLVLLIDRKLSHIWKLLEDMAKVTAWTDQVALLNLASRAKAMLGKE